MQNLLIAAGCLLVHALGAGPVLETIAPASGVAQEESAATTPSAHQGLIVALGLLEQSAPKGQLDVLSVESEVLPQTAGRPATVVVDFEIRMHGKGGAAAQKAYELLQANLAKELGKLAPVPFEYGPVVSGFIQQGMRASAVKSGVASGTHQGLVSLELPARLVDLAIPEETIKDTGAIPAYIRGVSAHHAVALGAIVIDQSKGDLDRTAFDIKAAGKDSKSKTFMRAQVANFLFKLEEGSGHVGVTKVAFALDEYSNVLDLRVRLSTLAER